MALNVCMAVYQSSIAGIVAASRGMCSTILAIDKVAIYRTVTQTVEDLTAEYQELGTRIKIAPDSDKAFMTTSEFYDQNIVDFEGLVNRLEEEGMPEQNEGDQEFNQEFNQGFNQGETIHS
ncbi:hypothetical protein LTR96_003738 [Exophiala xenobiotica]|nr:hypothetical protein LTR96_003738 [Exophiala xenobiotica]KAK5343144.1 hypothetical protein LTR98_000773 [Exophiala xenobiotica]